LAVLSLLVDSRLRFCAQGEVHVIPLEKAGIDQQAASKDKALSLLATHHVNFDPNSTEAKRVLRKIDMRIMPMVFVVYMLQLMDKNSLSFAAIMGIKTDCHLTAKQYSWLGSIVYFGYLGGEIPATFLMQRFSLSKYFSIMCMLWGIVVAMHAVCYDFAGLATVRFLLGAIEVCTAPAVIYITGSWYTKSEQITRVAIWYTTSGWANVFGGLFAFAINHAKTFKWQGLFVFYGCLTFCMGVILFFFLAASPTQASWLTDEEKTIALERVRENKTGSEVWRFNKSQLFECFTDIRFYMMFLLLVSTGLPNGGLTAFGELSDSPLVDFWETDIFRSFNYCQFRFQHRPVHTSKYGIWCMHSGRYDHGSISGKIHRSNDRRMLHALPVLYRCYNDVCYPG
jgi:ACS family allantoate permease-like MFS transporter